MKNVTCDIEEYITMRTAQIKQHLDLLLEEEPSPFITVIKAARYSLLSEGKKIRPILALATAEIFGSYSEKALQPACALEMVHTYSLIHDDLPCMDDDDFRRGKPSLHKVFGEAQATLAGDFLLTYAFEVLADAPHLSDAQKIKLVRLLAKNSGAEGMIGGQVMDIEAEDKKINIADLREIHERKTGALIAASIEFGAIVAEATEEHVRILRSFGHHIGLAFQIADDVIDVTSGKNSDSKNNKTTYVSLLGVLDASLLSKQYYQEAVDTLKKLPFDSSLLLSLADKLVNRSR